MEKLGRVKSEFKLDKGVIEISEPILSAPNTGTPETSKATSCSMRPEEGSRSWRDKELVREVIGLDI